jgi:8-oxo-dGTP diphosphatase
MHRKLDKLLTIGGHIELNETPWQAIKHELEEESGYKLAQLTLLQPKQRIKTLSDATLHPYPVAINTHNITDSHMHTDISYAFVTEQEPLGDIGLGESRDLRWLTQAEMNDLSKLEIYGNTKETYNFLLDECLSSWEHVPTDTFAL